MSSSSGADSGGGSGVAARVTIICSVCMDRLMEEGSIQVATPCGHVFHRHCLINWYTSSNKKNEERNKSQGKYSSPDCGETTESDSICKFRLFLKTEQDSDYHAMLRTVTQLGQEKNEIVERLNQEKAKALERLSKKQMETVDRLRLEHSEKVKRLQQEHDQQMKRQRQGHSNEKGQFLQLIQSQKNENQLLKDEIQWRKENIKKPIDLLQKRVKTLASEKLQREVDELMEKCKRLDKTDGSSGGECNETEATGFGRDGGAPVSRRPYRILSSARKSTGMPGSWQVRALASSGRDAAAAACGSGVQGTSSCTTSSVEAKFSNTLRKRPNLEILSVKQKPVIGESVSVPESSTTPPQQRSSIEKSGVSAAVSSGVAFKKQKIDGVNAAKRGGKR